MASSTGTRKVKLSEILLDLDVQPRVGPDSETIARYRERVREGESFPPVVVFQYPDGKFYLVDGRHRHDAYLDENADEIDAEVWEGTKEEAAEYAASCNTRHGLLRTPDDTRVAVANLLRFPKYQQMSSREVALVAKCSHTTVCSVRNEMAERGEIPPDGSVTAKDGRRMPARKKTRVVVDGEDVEDGREPKVVRDLKEKEAIPDGAIVTVQTNVVPGEPLSGADEDPFDPEEDGLYQALSGVAGEKYLVDAKAYLHPEIQRVFAVVSEPRFREACERFFTQCRKKSEGQNRQLTPFLYTLQALMKVRHVSEWELCKKCGGEGCVPGQGDCSSCRAGGYRT